MSGDCILRTFANPNFSGVMPGARFDASSGELTALDMPCCNGLGVCLVDEAGRGTMVRCGLMGRVSSTKEVLSKYTTRWDIATLPVESRASTNTQQLILQRLALSMNTGSNDTKKHKGLGFTTEGSDSGAVWWAAVAAAWRFGFKVHIIDLDEARRGPILPTKTWQLDRRPGAIFVDRVVGLWDPGLAQEFETLVGFCSRAEVPLWLSRIDASKISKGNGTEGAPPPEKKAGLSTRTAFSRRINASRNKSWDSWLRSDVRDKLAEAHDLLR